MNALDLTMEEIQHLWYSDKGPTPEQREQDRKAREEWRNHLRQERIREALERKIEKDVGKSLWDQKSLTAWCDDTASMADSWEDIRNDGLPEEEDWEANEGGPHVSNETEDHSADEVVHKEHRQEWAGEGHPIWEPPDNGEGKDAMMSGLDRGWAEHANTSQTIQDFLLRDDTMTPGKREQLVKSQIRFLRARVLHVNGGDATIEDMAHALFVLARYAEVDEGSTTKSTCTEPALVPGQKLVREYSEQLNEGFLFMDDFDDLQPGAEMNAGTMTEKAPSVSGTCIYHSRPASDATVTLCFTKAAAHTAVDDERDSGVDGQLHEQDLQTNITTGRQQQEDQPCKVCGWQLALEAWFWCVLAKLALAMAQDAMEDAKRTFKAAVWFNTRSDKGAEKRRQAIENPGCEQERFRWLHWVILILSGLLFSFVVYAITNWPSASDSADTTSVHYALRSLDVYGECLAHLGSEKSICRFLADSFAVGHPDAEEAFTQLKSIWSANVVGQNALSKGTSFAALFKQYLGNFLIRRPVC